MKISYRIIILLLFTIVSVFNIKYSNSQEIDILVSEKEKFRKEINYQLKIISLIKNKWNNIKLSKKFDKNTYALVYLKILKNGKIGDFWFEKESEISDFNKEIRELLLELNPYPEFSNSIEKDSIILSMRFNTN